MQDRAYLHTPWTAQPSSLMLEAPPPLPRQQCPAEKYRLCAGLNEKEWVGKGEHLPGHPGPHGGSADYPAQCKEETVRTSLHNSEITRKPLSTKTQPLLVIRPTKTKHVLQAESLVFSLILKA